MGHLREICYGEEGVLVKDIALDEPLQQIPRHRAAKLGTGEGIERPDASTIFNIHN